MLPVVDLSGPEAAEQFAAGAEQLGFLQLVGHGVSTAAAADLRRSCDAFFALDSATKQRFVDPRPEANRGFRAKGSEALSYSLGRPSVPDLFESFNCGPDARAGTHPLMAETPWPDDVVPGFSAAAHRWMAEMAGLAGRLDHLIDSVLGTELAAMSKTGPDTMACIDYRADSSGLEIALPGQQRMGAHSDYTTFTILDADPVPGLQIIGSDGEWIDVVPDEDALLVNVGDLLAIITDDRWPSTLHRVIPVDAGCAPTRRSVAYFHYPDLDVLVEPPASIENPRYEPVTVEAHLLGKLTAPKTHEAATGTSTAAGRRIE